MKPLLEMLADVDRTIKISRRWQRINTLLMVLNLGNGTAACLDIWSQESWLSVVIALVGFGAAAFIYRCLRRTKRIIAIYQVMRTNLLRFIEAEKVMYLTTTPAESALEQLMASIEDLKRRVL